MTTARLSMKPSLPPLRGLRIDTWLLGAVLMLAVGGLLMVYSSSSALGLIRADNDMLYLQSQLVRFLLGFVGLLALSQFDPPTFPKRTTLILWGGCILLLFALLLPFGPGVEIRGTRRWMRLGGLLVQPSEFARYAMLLHLAWLLANERLDLSTWRGIAQPTLVILATASLIAAQPHLSLGLLTMVSGFMLLFLAGACFWRLAVISLGSTAFAALVAVIAGKGYHLTRVLGFVNGLAGDLAFQAEQSIMAIGSGGLVGAGIGKGMQKYFFLPDPHTDFILSIFVEECGFVGLLILFLLVGFILFRIFALGSRAPKRLNELYCYGVGVQLLLAFILHAAVCMGLVPITGVPLPFVSFGGSALVANMWGMGLVLAASNGRSRSFRLYSDDLARLMRDPSHRKGRR
jgi:cell division protein FtsW